MADSPDALPADPREAADEIELARRARDGDAAAFGQLVARLMKPAFVVAYRLLGNREDAQDLVQEAFGRAYRKLGSFEPGREFRPWFFRILVRSGLNARESAQLRRTDELPEDARSPGEGPELAAERAELRARIRSALAALPPRQRLLVELVDLEGFAPADVAEMLEIAGATARWHLHMARGALRTILAAYEPGREGEP